MERAIAALTDLHRVAQSLRAPERLFITPLGALAVTLLVPVIVLMA